MDILILPFILTMTAVMEVQSQRNGDIRLMYGEDSTEGAVFMYKADQWWPICAERWTIYEAKVACRQLDFPYPYAISASLPAGIHINVSGLYGVWLDGFNCWTGDESVLNECWFRGWGTCDSGVPAGVTCHQYSVSESGFQFSWKFVWIGMAMMGGFISFVCYKKRDHLRMQSLQTTIHQSSSTLGESIERPLDVENQAYPTSPITHHTTPFNGGHNKNTTYITLPQSQYAQTSSLPTAPEEFLITSRIEGNAAPPPVGFELPPPYQIPDPLPQQGSPQYPSQDPASHDAPPGPIPPPPPTYDEATQ